MLLGSFVEEYDEKDQEEQFVIPDTLVQQTGSPGEISPTGTLTRPPTSSLTGHVSSSSDTPRVNRAPTWGPYPPPPGRSLTPRDTIPVVPPPDEQQQGPTVSPSNYFPRIPQNERLHYQGRPPR